MKLKVCGMREPENMQQLQEKVQPDYMGFIFHPASPRFVKERLQPGQMPTGVKKVGVFVNRPVAEVLEEAKLWKLDVIQLHGKEAPEDCEALTVAGLAVWKVFSVDEAFDFTVTQPYQGKAAAFLFDTKTPQYGGSGKQFNWQLLQQYRGKTPFWLSGGLDVESLEGLSVLSGLPLIGLDVNSRFEDAPGRKNIEQLLCLREALTALNRQNA